MSMRKKLSILGLAVGLELFFLSSSQAITITVVTGALGDLDGSGDGGTGEAAVLQTAIQYWQSRITTNRNFNLTVVPTALAGARGTGIVTAVDGSNRPNAGTIQIDNDGSTTWYVDPNPNNSVEFSPETTSDWRFDQGPAGSDLLRVLIHEIGHALGWLCDNSCGNAGLNPNYDAMMSPTPANFVSNANCAPPFPLASQAALAGCVFLQSAVATPNLNVSLRGDGLGGSGSTTVNELSHPGVREDLMHGLGVPASERELMPVVDVNMFQHAYGDTVDLPATANAGADIVSECNETGGSDVDLAGGGTDPEGGTLFFSWTCPGVVLSNSGVPNPMGFFNLNSTTTCRLDVSDLANLESDADSADVNVEDTTAPDINCPANLMVECSETGGTPASDTGISNFLSGASASDVCDASLSISDNAPGFFGLGDTLVGFSTSDDSGNAAGCSALVSVVDTTPPALPAPPDVGPVECTSPQGAAVNFPLPSASDVCDSAPSVGCAPPSGSIFPLGMTTVVCSATDGTGNQSNTDFEVSVADTTPPTIASVTATPDRLWPPNHRMIPIWVAAEASDTCDEMPSCIVTSVTSNENMNGRGDGDTDPDWVITGGLTLSLRAERSGRGAGRIYTIEVTCTDASSNSSSGTVVVTVPHDRR